MPLKHRTETVLVVLLTMVILLTALLIASLPDLPRGLLPWSIVFIGTVLYPIALYPLFKADRADYEFRTLHWVPAIMATLWLLLQLAAILVAPLSLLERIYTWAWLLPAAGAAIVALLIFCTKVIRQWSKRVFLIFLLFVPFATLALWSASGPHLEQSLSALLWENTLSSRIASSAAPMLAKLGINSSAILEYSESSDSSISFTNSSDFSMDPNEEKWKKFLQEYKETSESSSVARSENLRNDSIISSVSSTISSAEEEQGSILSFFKKQSSSDSSNESSSVLIGQNSSVPTKLVNSGMGWGFLILSMFSLYCAVLHRRQVVIA